MGGGVNLMLKTYTDFSQFSKGMFRKSDTATDIANRCF